MTTATSMNLAEPEIKTLSGLLLAGLSRNFKNSNNAAIPGQWQEFAPRIGHIDGQVGETAYGVIYNMDDDGNHEYLCAVEVASFEDLPNDLARLRLPAQRYAVFQHDGHVSEIQATCKAIWNEWLPTSGHEPADAPFFERYTHRFDPDSGYGGLEVWLPIK